MLKRTTLTFFRHTQCFDVFFCELFVIIDCEEDFLYVREFFRVLVCEKLIDLFEELSFQCSLVFLLVSNMHHGRSLFREDDVRYLVSDEFWFHRKSE